LDKIKKKDEKLYEKIIQSIEDKKNKVKENHAELEKNFSFTIKDDESFTIEHYNLIKEAILESKVIPYGIVSRIVKDVLKHFKNDSTSMNEISSHRNGGVWVVGDLHGQLPDFYTVMNLIGEISKRNKVLFNGDIVDRGPHGPELLILIYTLKLIYPSCVFINRGNHELRE